MPVDTFARIGNCECDVVGRDLGTVNRSIKHAAHRMFRAFDVGD
jgi:hypothetical protein